MSEQETAGAVRDEDAFDVAAMHAWLAERVDGLTGPPEVRQFTSGASNLTYLLRYPERELVLRRPPAGTKAASAHDMGREVRVQRGLGPHLDVVPEIVAFCRDESVIGSEFYVMQRLTGTILGADLPEGVTLSPERARRVSELVVDRLAELHAVDVDAAGLTDLDRGPGYVTRQVEGWSRRYRDALTDDVPDGEAVMAWLADHQPVDAPHRLIHGDWKLDNLVLDLEADPPALVGVLDWEMATVGDPLMDLGASMAYWVTADDDELFQALRRQPSHLPGMLGREQMVSRYLAATGRQVDDWRFYEVYGLFRLAVIVQQIWKRYTLGQTHNPAFRHFGLATQVLVDRAEARIG